MRRVVVAVVLVGAALPRPRSAFPGKNGKIAFWRTVDSATEPRCTYTANSNGTGETPLLGCDADYETTRHLRGAARPVLPRTGDRDDALPVAGP